jgi:hypothetical protein
MVDRLAAAARERRRKRYDPVLDGGDGFREGLNPSICYCVTCLTGKSLALPIQSVSSPICKNILLRRTPKSNLYPLPSRPTEGRHAIVTAAGRDAMDADALLTNGAEADGEVVWS